jgi:hypothetical protein
MQTPKAPQGGWRFFMAARKSSSTGRSFLLPLLWILLLLAVYWLLIEWRSLPGLVSTLELGFFR